MLLKSGAWQEWNQNTGQRAGDLPLSRKGKGEGIFFCFRDSVHTGGGRGGWEQGVQPPLQCRLLPLHPSLQDPGSAPAHADNDVYVHLGASTHSKMEEWWPALPCASPSNNEVQALAQEAGEPGSGLLHKPEAV